MPSAYCGLWKGVLKVPDTGTSQYWWIFGVPVLPENVIFTFFRKCYCYPEAHSTGMQKCDQIKGKESDVGNIDFE